MGLTITATLEEHGIYFAGDTLECHVRFANERSTQKLVARNPPSSAFVRGPREVPGHHSHLSRALGSGLSDGPRSAVVRPSGQSLLYSNGPPSAGYPAGNGNFFPNLDDNSEYSASSTPGGYAAPQYGGVVSNDAAAGGIKLQAVPANPRKSGAARADSVRAASRASERSGTGMQPYKRSGLSAFPSLGEHAGSPAETSPRLEASSAVQGGSGHKTSVVGGKGTAGGGIGPGGNAASQSERPSSYQSKSSLIPQRNTSSPRLPGASRPTQASSGRGADTDKVRIEPVGNDVKAHESSGVFPRLSSSSALSSPSTGFASWFSFGGKQKQQEADVQRQLKTPHTSLSHDGTASETGTGGLLGSLWRNISGGSPSRPATRAGTISGDACMEKLAIGFAEASGSLSLASSYIKPEQLELLLMHNGTDYSSKGSAKAIAIGGGMGSWVPPGSVQSPGSAGGRGQKCLPLLISSPTVLFSDLVLSPGESQTFSLKIQLPRSLPPSFNGRAARVSYDLVIVAKRNMFESNAYVVRIPFRVKAFVGQSGSPESFTLERPIRMLPNQSKLTHQELLLDSTPRNASPFLHAGKREGSVSAVAAGISGIELADRLAASTSVDLGDAGGTADGLCKQLSESSFLQSMLKHVDSDTENTNGVVPSIDFAEPNGSYTGSSQTEPMGDVSKRNIRTICRRRAPVSFSLSQAGSSVASVWLPKRVYQLGDMVAGKIHFQLASIHVYQVSIWLESVEVVANKFSNYESGRTEELTRKVHAEHHEFCRDTKTIGFALASLPIAAASFASAIVSNSWQLRIELIISMPGSPACDLALSAATQFPPSRHSLQRTPGATKHTPLSPISLQHQQQRTGLLSPRRYTISSDRSGGTRSGHSVPATPSAPTPATPTPASPTVTADGKFQANGWTPRLRSPTVTGGNAHQLPSPHIVSRPSTFSYRAAGQQHTHQPNKLSPPAPLDTAAAAAATSLGAKSVPPTAGPLSSVSEAGNEHSFPQSPAVKLPSDYSSIRAMRKRYDILQSIPTQTLSCTVSIQMHPSLSAALPSRHKDAFKIDLTKRA